MRQPILALFLTASILGALAAPARAETPCPAEEPSPYTPAPPPPGAPCAQPPICQASDCPTGRVVIRLRSPRFATADDRHEFLLHTNSAYRSALTMRRIGTAMAIIGGASSVIVGSVAGIRMMACSESYDGGDCEVSPALYVGVAASAIALAIGVTLAFSGHHRVKKIRKRFHVGIAPLPGGGAAALHLRF